MKTTTLPTASRTVHAAASVTRMRPTPGPAAARRPSPAPRPQAAATSKPKTAKVSVVVQACVESGMIVDSSESRRECTAWVLADPTTAVKTLVGWRKIKAAKAAKPTPRPKATTPAPVSPTTYPAGWSPARRPSPSGFRVGASSTKIHSGDAMATPRVMAGRTRADQPISSPRGATGFIAAATASAEANRDAAQAGRNAYADPHSMIAATSGQARAVQAAQTAELNRRAALHARQYGTPTLGS